MKKHPRKRQLVRPGLQLKMVAVFAGLTAQALVLQFMVVADALADVGARLPDGGEELLALAPGLLLRSLAISAGVSLALTISVGIVLTFRLAGPIHRLETYLDGVVRGDQVGPCKLRGYDELQGLCERVNAVSRLAIEARARAGAEPAEPPARRAG